MERIKVGDRVKVSSNSLSGAGTVMYIDESALFVDHFLPIQVLLDKP